MNPIKCPTKCPFCGERKNPGDLRCEACEKVSKQIDLAQTDLSAAQQERIRMDLELAEIRRRNAEATRDKKPALSKEPGAIREVSLEPIGRTLRKSDDED